MKGKHTMQSYLYNDDCFNNETPCYSDDERYDEEDEDINMSFMPNINGTIFRYPSYEDNEDMM